MKKNLIPFLLLISCGQPADISNKEKEKQVLDDGAVAMLHPFKATNIFYGANTYDHPLNAEFFKKNSIKEMRVKFQNKKTDNTYQPGNTHVYFFGNDGKLLKFLDLKSENDTSIYIGFAYDENGKLIKRSGIGGKLAMEYYYTNEKNVRKQSCNSGGIGEMWEWDDKGNLKKVIESSFHRSQGVNLFFDHEISEEERKNFAQQYAIEAGEAGLDNLNIVYTEKGFPISSDELGENGEIETNDEFIWEYDGKSRLLKLVYTNFLNKKIIHVFNYDEQGRLTFADDGYSRKLAFSYK